MKIKPRTAHLRRRLWTKQETSLILTFLKGPGSLLQNNKSKKQLEDLSKKLLAEVPICNCTPNQINNKIRNSRTSYIKVCNWIKKSGLTILQQKGYAHFKCVILQQCPFFEDFREIFGFLDLIPHHLRNVFDSESSVSQIQQKGANPVALCSPEPIRDLENEDFFCGTEINPDLSEQSSTIASRENDLLYENDFEDNTNCTQFFNFLPPVTQPEYESSRLNFSLENESNPYMSDCLETIAEQYNDSPYVESSQTRDQYLELELRKLEHKQKKLEFEKQKWNEEKILRQKELDIQIKKVEEDACTAKYKLQMKILARLWQ